MRSRFLRNNCLAAVFVGIAFVAYVVVSLLNLLVFTVATYLAVRAALARSREDDDPDSKALV
jgi:hypothetical protein